MSIITEPTQVTTIAVPELYRLSVDLYEQMAELGFLDDPRVELIGGLLVRKMTKNPPHTLAMERLRRLLEPLLPAGWYLREEKPIKIPDFDEPEPDLTVAMGDPEYYATRHPGPTDLALVIEVSESSLRRDRGEKLRAYAHGRIPEYWIVNLIDRVVERYSNPSPDRPAYLQRQNYGLDDSAPVLIQGVEVGRIEVAKIMP